MYVPENVSEELKQNQKFVCIIVIQVNYLGRHRLLFFLFTLKKSRDKLIYRGKTYGGSQSIFRESKLEEGKWFFPGVKKVTTLVIVCNGLKFYADIRFA